MGQYLISNVLLPTSKLSLLWSGCESKHKGKTIWKLLRLVRKGACRYVQFNKERSLSLVKAEGEMSTIVRKTPLRRDVRRCTEMIQEYFDCKTLSIRAVKCNNANSLEILSEESLMKMTGFVVPHWKQLLRELFSLVQLRRYRDPQGCIYQKRASLHLELPQNLAWSTCCWFCS